MALQRSTQLNLLYALTLVFAAGCAGGSDDAGLPTAPGSEQMGPGMPGAEQPPGNEDPGGDRVAPGVRQLVIDGQLSHLATFGERVALPVFYLDSADAPIANQRVTARLLDAPGGTDLGPAADGSGLGSTQVTTDAAGLATFELLAGAVDTRFTIEASADGAAPVYWTIAVGAAPGGSLTVIIEASAAPDHAYVGLHQSPGCNAAEGGAPAMQQVGPVDLQPPTTSVNVGDLAAGVVVSVAVTGHDASGQAVAFGCVDGVQIKGSDETVVRVTIDDAPLNVGGTFAVVHNFDLTQALGENAVLRTIGEIGGGNVSRGSALVDLLCDNIELNDIICIGLRAIGGGVIDNLIDTQVPPETLEALDALGDLYDAVSDLTVHGQMTLTTPNGDRLSGNTQRWTELSFQWRDGCPFDDPAQCMNTFSMADLEVPGGAVEGTFEASLSGETQVSIESHVMPLPYGTAVRVAAEYWVLPNALGRGGPVTVEDVVADLVPCAALAAQVPVLSQDFCEDTIITALADLIYDQFSQLNPGLEGMQLSGTVQTVDTTGNRQADRLEEGMWNATVDGLGAVTGVFGSR
ncbi:MAG: hypothetical protein ACE366_10655 [Bradymonadia bacterium]